MLKKQIFLKGIYNQLTVKLAKFVECEGAEIICLNILEQLPTDIQVKMLSDLSQTNNPKFIRFFQLVTKEMGGVVRQEANRALTKLSYLGFDINIVDYSGVCGKKIKAFASSTRLRGNCILVLLVQAGQEYQAHYFTLIFNHLGIKGYFQHSSLKETELLANIKRQKLVSLKFAEAQQLLLEAYEQNKRYGTKVAKGFSQYQKFLEIPEEVVDHQNLLFKLNEEVLSPNRIINAYFSALKNMDSGLVYDLSTLELQNKLGSRKECIVSWCHPFQSYIFIKSILGECHKKDQKLFYKVSLIASNENDELQRINFRFELEKDQNKYKIADVNILEINPISKDDALNPLNYQVYACIYNFTSFQSIKTFFEENQSIYLTGEFEGGNCYKWFQTVDPLEKGIDISKDVYCEFILTDKELIVFGSNLKNVTEISYSLGLNIKGIREENILQLKSKSLYTIRDIYQVISNPKGLFIGDSKNQGTCYFIPPASYSEWYKFCLKRTEQVLITDKRIKVFHLNYKNNVIEIIFHENTGIINLFKSSFSDVLRELEFPPDKIFNLHDLLTESNNSEKWYKLKLITILKKDPLTKMYGPTSSPQKIAKKFNLVINN